MARFFIDRPVFAWVVSILIMLMGGLAITKLPVAQYPNIAPPSVSVTATYAGASAEILQDTVTSVIEQQMNGIDGLLYISSTSDSSGQSVITLYFQPGTNPDIAQVQVQNKLQLATPSLPQVVQQQGIVVAKATRNFLMFFTLSSTNGSMDEIALGNYIASHVLDPIRRVDGVGGAQVRDERQPALRLAATATAGSSGEPATRSGTAPAGQDYRADNHTERAIDGQKRGSPARSAATSCSSTRGDRDPAGQRDPSSSAR